MGLLHLPLMKSWRLNERFYGGLTGLNKQEIADKFGEEQVHIWRRSYNVRPPPMDQSHSDHPVNDLRYKDIPKSLLPDTECLEDTKNRVKPFFEDYIMRDMMRGEKVLIVAHGNSIRAMVQLIENLNKEEIMQVEIPTGIPLIYHLD